MELLKKAFRLVIFVVLLALLLGTDNVQTQPMLLAFLAVMAVIRAAELLHVASESLIHWYRAESYPRWIVWLSGMGFLTNLVLPILDHRYRGETFWPSPLPQAPWWLAVIGLLLLIAGSVLRFRSITVLQAPKPETSVVDKRRKKDKAPEKELEEPASPIVNFEPAFYLATALSYFGVAVFFTSLWGVLAISLVILPPLFFGRNVQARTVTN